MGTTPTERLSARDRTGGVQKAPPETQMPVLPNYSVRGPTRGTRWVNVHRSLSVLRSLVTFGPDRDPGGVRSVGFDSRDPRWNSPCFGRCTDGCTIRRYRRSGRLREHPVAQRPLAWFPGCVRPPPRGVPGPRCAPLTAVTGCRLKPAWLVVEASNEDCDYRGRVRPCPTARKTPHQEVDRTAGCEDPTLSRACRAIAVRRRCAGLRDPGRSGENI